MQSQELSVEDDFTITISVQDPQLDQAGGFTTYLITGNDKLGSFEIRRRFNYFYQLREGLRKKWPGCYIPPVPSKKITVAHFLMQGNKEDKFIEERRRGLSYFCEKVAGIKYIYYCDCFQLLIRTKGGDIEKSLEAMPTPSTLEKLNIYKQLFGEHSNKENPHDLKAKTNSFYVYLKKSEKELKLLKEDMREVAAAKRTFNDTLNVCNNIMLPEYEKAVFIEYVNQQQDYLIFTNNVEVTEKARELKEFSFNNAFDFLSDLLAFESREVEAMQEAVATREQYERTGSNKVETMKKLQDKRKDDQDEMSKLVSGKTTFKSIFTKGTKADQIKLLERTMSEDEKEIEYLGQLVDLINVVLGAIEIPKFKRYKQRQYYEILNRASKMELKHLHLYAALLKSSLVANQNIKLE